jgi:hypothetical protein
MDSHADTCLAGANWSLYQLTDETCDVVPFSDDLGATKNIPIGTCATLIVTKSGREFILWGHEMLWFGNRLQHSLINPNQIRYNRGRVQDDPTRHDEPFGITTDQLYIPFQIDGTTVYFDTRAPTLHEMENLPYAVLTSEERWDPSRVRLRISATTSYQAIETDLDRPCVTDSILSSISPTLVDHEMDTRLIASVQVQQRRPQVHVRSTTRTTSNNSSANVQLRHSVHDAQTLARIWGIGITTAHNAGNDLAWPSHCCPPHQQKISCRPHQSTPQSSEHNVLHRHSILTIQVHQRLHLRASLHRWPVHGRIPNELQTRRW